MRVTYDAEADMAYIQLVERIEPGEAVRQVPAGDGTTAVLDFDAEGRLLGVELSGAARTLHPDLMAAAGKAGRD
ncbi:DUF2283 domain-containing protein [Streptomyces thermolilacinus]|uniref:DUF2283 domain-containing protein n=1 Tax=Streptomyces thermolilacinus TaxID=285540 RepID=UPI00340F155C